MLVHRHALFVMCSAVRPQVPFRINYIKARGRGSHLRRAAIIAHFPDMHRNTMHSKRAYFLHAKLYGAAGIYKEGRGDALL